MPGTIQIGNKQGLDALQIDHVTRFMVSPRPVRAQVYGGTDKKPGFFLSVWMDNGSAFDLAWFEDAPSAKAKYQEILKIAATAGPTALVKFPSHEALGSLGSAEVLSALVDVERRLESIAQQLPAT